MERRGRVGLFGSLLGICILPSSHFNGFVFYHILSDCYFWRTAWFIDIGKTRKDASGHAY